MVSSQLNYYVNMDLEALKPRKLGKNKYCSFKPLRSLSRSPRKDETEDCIIYKRVILMSAPSRAKRSYFCWF